MKTYQDGTFYVFTFKDGLLARLAHDLRLSLQKYEIHVDGDKIEASFWPESLEVDGAIAKGALKHGELSEKDKKTIQSNLQEKVLLTQRHPTITFQGQGEDKGGGRYQISGQLTLQGRAQPISLEIREQGDSYTGGLELVPSRWGIQPFKALGGAIKLQDRLKVEFALKK